MPVSYRKSSAISIFREIARFIENIPTLGQAKYLLTPPFMPNSYLHALICILTDNSAQTHDTVAVALTAQVEKNRRRGCQAS